MERACPAEERRETERVGVWLENVWAVQGKHIASPGRGWSGRAPKVFLRWDFIQADVGSLWKLGSKRMTCPTIGNG